MNTNFLVIRFLAVITTASSFFVSCDDDISDVGSNTLIGSDLKIEQRSDFVVNIEQINITEDNPPVTNNLDYYLLGDKSNGFTDTKYGIVTRFLGLQNPPGNTNSTVTATDGTVTITETKNTITSATLVIPYIYTNDIDNLGATETNYVYSISKIEKGSSNLNLQVFQLDTPLFTTDPASGFNATFQYFADGSTTYDDYSLVLNETIPIGSEEAIELPGPNSDGSDFEFDVTTFDFNKGDNGEYLDVYEINQGLEYTIRIPLDASFVSKLNQLIDNGDETSDISIFSDEAFYNELPSIYIKSSNSDGGVAGVMPSSSLFTGGLELVFQTEKTKTENGIVNEEESTTEDDDPDDWITTSMLSFSGNPINIFTKDNDDTKEAEGTVFLESGLGSISNLTIFDDNNELLFNDITSLINQNILLNDAILKFTVNTAEIEIENLPENLIVHSLENGEVLTGHPSKFSTEEIDNEIIKQSHLSSLVIPENDYPYYEINITDYLANILRQDSEEDAIASNLNLALSVTEDVGIISASRLKNKITEEYVNQGSLLCFKAVPLFNASAADEETRPRLTIKYTPTK